MTDIEKELTKITGHLENIQETIVEMKNEREKYKDTFWLNMNTMKNELQNMRVDEATCRTQVSGKLNLIEEKMNSQNKITSIISTAISAGIAGLKTMYDYLK